jgi:hypothetical protein
MLVQTREARFALPPKMFSSHSSLQARVIRIRIHPPHSPSTDDDVRSGLVGGGGLPAPPLLQQAEGHSRFLLGAKAFLLREQQGRRRWAGLSNLPHSPNARLSQGRNKLNVSVHPPCNTPPTEPLPSALREFRPQTFRHGSSCGGCAT